MSTFGDRLKLAKSHDISSEWEEMTSAKSKCRRWNLFGVSLYSKEDSWIMNSIHFSFSSFNKDSIKMITTIIELRSKERLNSIILTVMFSVMDEGDGAEWKYFNDLKVEAIIE